MATPPTIVYAWDKSMDRYIRIESDELTRRLRALEISNPTTRIGPQHNRYPPNPTPGISNPQGRRVSALRSPTRSQSPRITKHVRFAPETRSNSDGSILHRQRTPTPPRPCTPATYPIPSALPPNIHELDSIPRNRNPLPRSTSSKQTLPSVDGLRPSRERQVPSSAYSTPINGPLRHRLSRSTYYSRTTVYRSATYSGQGLRRTDIGGTATLPTISPATSGREDTNHDQVRSQGGPRASPRRPTESPQSYISYRYGFVRAAQPLCAKCHAKSVVGSRIDWCERCWYAQPRWGASDRRS